MAQGESVIRSVHALYKIEAGINGVMFVRSWCNERSDTLVDATTHWPSVGCPECLEALAKAGVYGREAGPTATLAEEPSEPLQTLAEELTDLARQAAASKHWRWLPGMRGVCPGRGGFARHHETVGRGTTPWTSWNTDGWDFDGWDFDDLVPDLVDATTRGGLLALVREAWRMPTGITVHYNDDTARWVVSWSGATHGGTCGEGASEGEALLRALLSAP